MQEHEQNLALVVFLDKKIRRRYCIGSIFAQRIGIPFLTRDKEFQHMENVVFVAKA